MNMQAGYNNVQGMWQEGKQIIYTLVQKGEAKELDMVPRSHQDTWPSQHVPHDKNQQQLP